MIPDPRKLKRGLKDISPLFDVPLPPPAQAETSVPPLPEADPRIQCVGLYSPSGPSEQLFIQTLIASQLLDQGMKSSILSLNPEHKQLLKNVSSAQAPKPLRRYTISLDQFKEICAHPAGEKQKHAPLQSEVFFIDFDYFNAGHFEKVIPLLDKMILHLKADMDSLTNAYKLLKAAIPLTNRLEYFVMIDGAGREQKGSFLFERFAEIVSRHLGLSVNWFGSFKFADKLTGVSMMLDNLLTAPQGRSTSIEKRAIASFLHSSEAREMQVS